VCFGSEACQDIDFTDNICVSYVIIAVNQWLVWVFETSGNRLKCYVFICTLYKVHKLDIQGDAK
jgi:hypothetical protein